MLGCNFVMSPTCPATRSVISKPPEIIRLAVMLSLRNVEDLLHERGIDVSHETVRYWWNRLVQSLRPRSVASEHSIYVPGRNGVGIWMRCSSASTARSTIFGAPSTITAKSSKPMLPRTAVAGTVHKHRNQKWLHNFGRWDKWIVCLTAGTVVPANQEKS